MTEKLNIKRKAKFFFVCNMGSATRKVRKQRKCEARVSRGEKSNIIYILVTAHWRVARRARIVISHSSRVICLDSFSFSEHVCVSGLERRR